MAERALRSEQQAGRIPPAALWNAVQAKWDFIRGDISEALLRLAWEEELAVWFEPRASSMIGPVAQEAAWIVRGATWPFAQYSKYTWGGFQMAFRGAMVESDLPRPGFPIKRDALNEDLSELLTQAFGG